MTKNVNYVIRKIPLASRPSDRPAQFPYFGQLYLELLENKKKVKPHLVNVDFIPRHEADHSPTADYRPETPQYSPAEPRAERVEREERDDSPAPSDASPVSWSKEPSSPTPTDDEESETSIKSRVSNVSESRKRLFELLKKKDEPFVKKYSVSRPPTKPIEASRRLPTLSELERQNKIEIKREVVDGKRYTNENENLKRELMFKFDILRKSYKNTTVEIPSPTIYEDYESMCRQYETTLRRLSLDTSVDNYKTYLTYGFMGMEFVLGNWFKLDMAGYTQQQLASMEKYEHLLIEIGEKRYIPQGKKWSVEIRLVCVILMNTAMFVVSKQIFQGAGAGILGALNNMKMPAPPDPAGARAPHKMRGPTISVDELPA